VRIQPVFRWIASGCDAHPASNAAKASDAHARRRKIDSRWFLIIDYWPNIVLFSQRTVCRTSGENDAPQLARTAVRPARALTSGRYHSA
jgi:hypothetical protein